MEEHVYVKFLLVLKCPTKWAKVLQAQMAQKFIAIDILGRKYIMKDEQNMAQFLGAFAKFARRKY